MNMQQRATTSSSGSSDGAAAVAAAGAVPGSAQDEYMRNGQNPYRLDGVSAGTRPTTADEGEGTGHRGSYFGQNPDEGDVYAAPGQEAQQEQSQSFLGGEPAQTSSGLARQGSSSYRDWMAPAAVGVAGAGAAGMGYAAYQHRDDEDVTAEPSNEDREQTTPAAMENREAPETYQPSGFAAATSDNPADTDDPSAFSTSNPVDSTPEPATGTEGETSDLGGLEREGAHETGRIFPTILRHDTDISVSQLHVPGKFPRGG